MAGRRRCPICAAKVTAAADNPAFPFCSPRCKLLDLGNWLGEHYRVPSEPADDFLPPDWNRDPGRG